MRSPFRPSPVDRSIGGMAAEAASRSSRCASIRIRAYAIARVLPRAQFYQPATTSGDYAPAEPPHILAAWDVPALALATEDAVALRLDAAALAGLCGASQARIARAKPCAAAPAARTHALLHRLAAHARTHAPHDARHGSARVAASM
jgi:hypothetical protein